MSQIKLLFIDDDPNALEPVPAPGSDAPLQIQAAATPTEALLLLERWRPDVVVVGSQLAQKDDFLLLKTLKEHKPPPSSPSPVTRPRDPW